MTSGVSKVAFQPRLAQGLLGAVEEVLTGRGTGVFIAKPTAESINQERFNMPGNQSLPGRGGATTGLAPNAKGELLQGGGVDQGENVQGCRRLFFDAPRGDVRNRNITCGRWLPWRGVNVTVPGDRVL